MIEFLGVEEKVYQLLVNFYGFFACVEVYRTQIVDSRMFIINIKKTEKGKDSLNKTRIQLKVYASSPNIQTKEEKESLGERINYNMRKSIVDSFKSENISNKLYNPAFSDSYSFTTANVEWV